MNNRNNGLTLRIISAVMQLLVLTFVIFIYVNTKEIKKKLNETYTATVEPVTSFNNTAEDMLKKMTLDEKIYQMFFVTPELLTDVGNVVQAGEATKKALEERPVGGIIYFSANIKNKKQVMDMIGNTQKYSKTPLFIGVDEEGGRVARISGNNELGFEKIPAMSVIGETNDPKKSYAVGETIASNIKALGFNVNFAPVADIITNPNNKEIGDRAFGNDPKITALMVEQQVLGLQENGVSAAVKHFPGHGSTQANSHDGYSESLRTLDEFRLVEFEPFKAGINAGTDFVLVSHMSAVNVDTSGLPASLSKKIITDILKSELGFEKLVVTDSLSMGAITTKYSAGEAAILAIEAGVDILLIPKDIKDAFNSIKEAVSTGKLTEKRIDESVLKILQVKKERGIIK